METTGAPQRNLRFPWKPQIDVAEGPRQAGCSGSAGLRRPLLEGDQPLKFKASGGGAEFEAWPGAL